MLLLREVVLEYSVLMAATDIVALMVEVLRAESSGARVAGGQAKHHGE